MTRTRGSRAGSEARSSTDPSLLPSSTRISSYGRPHRSSTWVNSVYSRSRFGASWWRGRPTARASIGTTLLRSPPAAPEHDRDAHDGDGHRHPDRQLRHVLSEVQDGPVAVTVREQRLYRVAEAAADEDRREKGTRRD